MLGKCEEAILRQVKKRKLVYSRDVEIGKEWHYFSIRSNGKTREICRSLHYNQGLVHALMEFERMCKTSKILL